MTAPASPADKLSHCPLCGAPNGCALAAGEGAKACWCMGVVVPSEALARLPQEERRLRCLCAACAQGPKQPATALI